MKIAGEIGIRAATRETPQGIVYTVSLGQGEGASGDDVCASTRRPRRSSRSVLPRSASQQYVAAISADPTGRYLYYVPGAHGGSDRDGSAVVQFDTRRASSKVIAFLHPFYEQKYGLVPKGTYGRRRRSGRRQALRHLERQPRLACLGLLRRDDDPHSGVRANGLSESPLPAN